MGLYLTTTSLQTRMVSVDFDSLTTALASEMITDAESEVNKFLSRRYDLSSSTFQTTTSIPPIVRTLASRLAESYMWINTSRGSKESLTRGNQLEKSVLQNLLDISEYKVDLVDTAGAVIVDMSNTAYRVLCNTSTYEPTFDEGRETAWRVDKDKREDIADAKE